MICRSRRCTVLALSVIGWSCVACGCRPASKSAPAAKEATRRSDASEQPAQVVRIDNFTFNPSTLTVAAGAKVTWVNHDDVPHTATSSAQPKAFDSGALDSDAEFSHVFAVPGTYDYFCAIHPHMTGRIVVK